MHFSSEMCIKYAVNIYLSRALTIGCVPRSKSEFANNIFSERMYFLKTDKKIPKQKYDGN